MSSSDPPPNPTPPPSSGTSGGSGSTGGGSTGDNADGDAKDSTKSATAANLFTFATVVMGLLALIVLTLFVVAYYGKDGVSSATSILGIIMPPVAAIFGATVAYSVGDSKGATKGEETAKKDVKATFAPKLQRIDSTVDSLVSKIQTHGTSRRGSDRVVFPVRLATADTLVEEGLREQFDEDELVGFDQSELNDVRAAVSELRAAIDAL